MVEAKRVLDVAAATVGLVALAPVLGLIALLVKLDSRGPVLFVQERVGRYGRPFRIHKFRTMHVAASKSGPRITAGQDPRITGIGRFLRQYKLDELPQLFDVVCGSMSLVGPRPELPHFVERYPEDIREVVLSVRPGMTDLASLLFVDESRLLRDAKDPEREYVQTILPLKLEYCVEYVRRRSLLLDLRIIFATLLRIVRHHDSQSLRGDLGWSGEHSE